MFHWEQAQLSPMCAQHAPLSTTFMTIQLTFTITTVSFRTMLSLRIQLFTQLLPLHFHTLHSLPVVTSDKLVMAGQLISVPI